MRPESGSMDSSEHNGQRRIAVVGPTASGKSELAVTLAARMGGEIISTDSLQVYRHLDIGTAKPTPQQRARAPHHLLDMVNPDESYSAGRYVADGTAVLARLHREHKPALLCGGTGLYFRALLLGLAEVPPIPPEVRERVLALHAEHGLAACRTELERLDPQGAAALRPADTARTLRALEVILATGRPLREFQRRKPFRAKAENLLSVGIGWDRAALYERINRRTREMLEQGWIEEVRRVQAMGYGPELKPMRAIGYKEICALLAGQAEEEGLADRIAQRTRRYAKRQLTWFRNQQDVFWRAPGEEGQIVERVEFFLKTGE
jgi:tRNA dimethylallyltransferase